MPKEKRPTDLQLDYRKCFGGPSGERTLEHLLQVCGVFSGNFANDPLELARNEGRRAVGLHILAMIGRVKLPQKEILCPKN
jgi:hypothetical protein